MCQNFNLQPTDISVASQSKDETQVLYDSLIGRLAQQVRYLEETNNFLTNDHLYEALRVLSMERSGDFSLSKNFYASFGVDVSNKKKLQ